MPPHQICVAPPSWCVVTVEEWRHVARALGACYSNAETELPPDMRDPLPGEAGFDQWADETFGAEAAALIVAFDAIMEFRWPQTYVMGGDQPPETPADPADDDIERVARRMARSDARDNHIPADRIDAEVDKYWHLYEEAAAQHLYQLRSGNA